MFHPRVGTPLRGTSTPAILARRNGEIPTLGGGTLAVRQIHGGHRRNAQDRIVFFVTLDTRDVVPTFRVTLDPGATLHPRAPRRVPPLNFDTGESEGPNEEDMDEELWSRALFAGYDIVRLRGDYDEQWETGGIDECRILNSRAPGRCGVEWYSVSENFE